MRRSKKETLFSLVPRSVHILFNIASVLNAVRNDISGLVFDSRLMQDNFFAF
jgi:hypothetical protein